MINKILTILSRIISIVFSPLMMPTYGALIVFMFSYLYFAPAASRLSVIAVTFAVSCMLPVIAIYLLYKLKRIGDPSLNNRSDRTIPYIICAACYAGLTFYYMRVHAPVWMSAFMCSAIFAVATCAIVNLRWKISGHMTGMGGLCALAFSLVYHGYNLWIDLWLPVILVIIAGFVGTARLILERHTLAQVTAGFFNGLAWVLASQFMLPVT